MKNEKNRLGARGAGRKAFRGELGEARAEMGDWREAAGGSVLEVMAGWTAPQFLVSARRHLASMPEGVERFKLLLLMVGAVASLQRGAYWCPRLELGLERERVELEKEKFRHAVKASSPEAKERPDCLRPMTDEERHAIIGKVDEIMGLK